MFVGQREQFRTWWKDMTNIFSIKGRKIFFT